MSVQLVVGSQVWVEVLNIVANAREEIALVSPYNHKLDELVTKLKNANRGVKISRYFRQGKTDPTNHFDGVISYPVPDLHAKIYTNERTALITSLNLTYGSVVDNLEVGLLISDTTLVNEINNYVNKLSTGASRSRSTLKSPTDKTMKAPTGKINVRKRSDIRRGEQLTRTYKGVLHTCTVEEPGSEPKVRYKSKRGISLSEAAREVTGQESISGPWFWWYGDIQVHKLRYA